MGRSTIAIKQVPSDFQVAEILGQPLTGTGEHSYFFVEKQNLNTQDVVKRLCTAYDVERTQVGYAGRKDKHALTRQWFSVNEPTGQWRLAEELKCLSIVRHSRKLRIGELAGNLFRICCRTSEPIKVCAGDLQGHFPNHFGAQRFGHSNLQDATTWLLQRRQRRIGRAQKSWHLSVLRSFLFNEVLNYRIQHGSFATVLDGDFAIDGLPTGPLWGRGRSPTQGLAGQLEREALQEHHEICEALEYAGVDQGRRPLAGKPISLFVSTGVSHSSHRSAQVSAEPASNHGFWLSFGLSSGVYATSLLSHHFELGQLGGDENPQEGARGEV
ncbi:MAG: tRNA pseudouridine(13) synthase TruD [Pseudomonadota bacterium]